MSFARSSTRPWRTALSAAALVAATACGSTVNTTGPGSSRDQTDGAALSAPGAASLGVPLGAGEPAAGGVVDSGTFGAGDGAGTTADGGSFAGSGTSSGDAGPAQSAATA